MLNRLKENILFISSDPFRIIIAKSQGFFALPVIQFESFYRDDYQLNLVENYLLQIRHLEDMVSRLKYDFEYLVQRVYLEIEPHSSKQGVFKNQSFNESKSQSSSSVSGGLKNSSESEGK